MGKINIGYINYVLKRRVYRFLPYKIRRPLLLVSLFIGLYGYFRFMIVISSRILGQPSAYLLYVQSVFVTVYTNLISMTGIAGTIGITGFIFVWLIYKYCIPIVSKEDRKPNTYYAKSLYYSINKAVSFMNLIVTVLAFLPLLMKGVG